MRPTAKSIAFFAALTCVATAGAAWATVARAIVTCNSASPCTGGSNTAAGIGIDGASVAGIGVEGASTKTNPGIWASTVAAAALAGKSVSGAGAQGTSTSSDGVLATTSAAKSAAIVAEATAKTPAYAVSGIAPAGTGIAASGVTAFSGVASANCFASPAGVCFTNAPPVRFNSFAVTALTVHAVGTQTPLVLLDAKGQVVFSVDPAGTVFFAGKLNCPLIAQELVDASQGLDIWICQGADYSPLVRGRGGNPAEFDGQAVVAGGVARIALPPDDAAKVAGGYRVFLTPLGDTAGSLFVDGQSAQGFTVRERGTSAATTPFAYRVVAAQPAPSASLAAFGGDAETLLPGSAAAAGAALTPALEPQAVPLVTTCASASACVEGNNTGTGPAVLGQSKTGYGVVGTTQSGAGAGVLGSAVAAAGAYGTSASGYGLRASSTSGTGLAGTTSSKTAAGVLGQSSAAGGIGITAVSTSGTAVYGSGIRSFSGIGGVTVTGKGGAPLLIVRSATNRDVFSVDTYGTLGFGGIFNCPAAYRKVTDTVDGFYGLTCQAQNPNAKAGKARVERIGEARLVDGVASVALDPAFARRLDPSQPYGVTLTPEGDSAGWLYVASRTPNGFTVREHGGHSSLAFEYDAVADVPDTAP